MGWWDSGQGGGDDSRLRKFSSSGGKTHYLPPIVGGTPTPCCRGGLKMPSSSSLNKSWAPASVLCHPELYNSGEGGPCLADLCNTKAMLQIFTQCGIQAKGKGSMHPGGISRRCCGENGDTWANFGRRKRSQLRWEKWKDLAIRVKTRTSRSGWLEAKVSAGDSKGWWWGWRNWEPEGAGPHVPC